MNPSKRNLQALLDDVLPSAGEHCGPSSAELSAMLRCERRRRRSRAVAVGLALTALVSGSLQWRNERTAWPPFVPAPAKPASIVVQEVNDEQLLALLHAMPVALMEWPNGERTLLIVEQGTTP
jgi:hypothetical protein